ncbi:iron dicitrate transport regulator FecR [Bradyrhizobium sp. KBS0727]|uniref:FecR family protein n=2 Tax=unclassified Bradyrhizobium TaxID=2631580 RepID=UPI00110F20F3|nr:FecR family protein [Bradyrhizobium sp. KBS0725]QDW40323.1 iron dicitrate transport regulator FecR [Bradyrhizobium sp. KBS0725]QDW46927.1 iron dicitrate transport regulator FecR [Bradyrhizobium sp. KBS0727]
MPRLLSLALLLLVCSMPAHAANISVAAADQIELAQAQPAPAQPAAPAPVAPNSTAPAADAQAPEEPIGNVATVTGNASVVRNNATTPLKAKDDIYLNDVVQTGANSSLGITFIDATTFNLKANAQITIDTYVYEDGGKNNAGIFDVAKGTVAFVAASVAKTGDMKITTPTATLGIRGTTGLVEVPEGGGTSATNNIKLYPDADGKVGRIEVNDRAGARLGFLTQGASGFTIRPGIGGARVVAVPLVIPPQMMQRDQGFVRQVYSTQTLGRQVVLQQRDFRRANPNFVNPNRPIRQQQPGQQPNGAPGQNRPGQQQQRPGAPNRQGQQQPGSPAQPGTAPRTGQQKQPGAPTHPGTTPRAGQPQQPGTPAQPGTTPRTGLPQQPGTPSQPGLSPRTGQPQPPDTRSQPGLPPRVGPTQPPQPGLPPRAGQPPLPAQPSAPQGQPGLLNRIAPHVPGLSRIPGMQGAPALRPGALPRRAVPPKGKLPKNVR